MRHALVLVKCERAEATVDGATCLEACGSDPERVEHVRGEPCDLLCTGCPQWEQ